MWLELDLMIVGVAVIQATDCWLCYMTSALLTPIPRTQYSIDLGGEDKSPGYDVKVYG